eukprot:SAG31_NODE_20529_length_572_cov_0.714588_1_plen_162_part_10
MQEESEARVVRWFKNRRNRDQRVAVEMMGSAAAAGSKEHQSAGAPPNVQQSHIYEGKKDEEYSSAQSPALVGADTSGLSELHEILTKEIGADIRDQPETVDSGWDPDTDAVVGDLVAVREPVVLPITPTFASREVFNQNDVPSAQCIRCPEDEVEAMTEDQV